MNERQEGEPVTASTAKVLIRRIPLELVPLIAAVVAALIFFGAAAVSSRVEARQQDLFAQVSQNASSEIALSADESWWEKSVLLVCPFH